ncbi:sulfite exporter TauE/SafE family protein [Oscillatoria sp. CS-180]|uniref:nickel/cobalt transporter n=1 Tax=Oscillatoria sp. CS-180 TaxID=3021720 RepID=UPI00232E90F7|nr:sulfite exporter TauE/SafE family protein [Oscillatoria sp. CS-180]MDB9526364.1 sulfite exporter TauE/SafE family protein [Oscillatoria sp. CS-180]
MTTLTLILAHVEAAHQLTRLLETPLSTGAIATGMAIAVALGAVHALSPGHGKALVGAYLVGSQGTPGAALWLGITTTITHTLTVFILGLTTLITAQYLDLDQIYPVLGALSGLTICWVGLRLLWIRLRAGSTEHPHAHPHSHNHDHTHDPPTDWPSLLTIGISGGIVPCPAALVLLLSAIALHQVAYGLVLISGFSLGLAAVLTGLGLTAVYARRWLEQMTIAGDLIQKLSVLSAAITVCLGLSLTTVAIMG